jgi:5-methyltetrahydrofolate--homocysteine methyltransferase
VVSFKERLSQPGILIADGATGTTLHRAGLPRGAAPERWNLENPEGVRNLHRSYMEAGADIILTNTFGGTRYRLERDRLGDRVYEVNVAAARLAKEVAGEGTIVFGDIGPTGQLLKPYGKLSFEDTVDAFYEQARGLADGGVDAILIETMSDLNEAKAALQAVRKVTSLPVLITMSFDTHGRTMMGVKPETAARELWSLNIDVIGANCGRTLSETLEAILEMRQAVPEATLMAKPNAGLPHRDAEDTVFDITPDIMADYAVKFVEGGVKIFGGCCGSTPEHIKAVAAVLKNRSLGN